VEKERNLSEFKSSSLEQLGLREEEYKTKKRKGSLAENIFSSYFPS